MNILGRYEAHDFPERCKIGVFDTGSISGVYPLTSTSGRPDLAMVEVVRADVHRGAVEDLAKIADLAKYLREPAWNAEGIRLVGEQIQRLAAPHLGGR